MGERFTLVLSAAAGVAELEAWLSNAGPRHRATYATGLDLPADAPGVALVRRWADQGLVHLFRERDPVAKSRWLFIVERAGVGMPGSAAPLACGAALPGGGTSCCVDHAPASAPDAQVDELLALLRTCGSKCPSNRAIARELGLGNDQRGRRRADYLLTKLAQAGAITLTNNGTNAPRGLVVHHRGES